MDRRRVGVLLVLLGVSLAGIRYKAWLDEQELLVLEARSRAPAPTPKPVRNWRWPQEGEWVVHQVVRHMLSWGHTGAGDPPAVSVRRGADENNAPAFEVTLTGGGANAVLSLRPPAHLWDPAGYVGAVRSIEGSPSGPGTPVAGINELLLVSDTPSLVKADRLLFEALSTRPLDARLHEQAALLWAAHAMRNSATWRVDSRPFLNGVTAHLALAHVLSGGAPSGIDGELAGIVMDVLLWRQVDAMRRLDAIEAKGTDAATRAWVNALRTRVTLDPRRAAATPPRTRIEKLEALYAINRTRGDCALILSAASAWRLRPSADWARDSLTCVDERYLAVFGNPLELQGRDAMELADVQAEALEDGVRTVAGIANTNTHQPARPTAIVPREVRADAGLRRIAHAYQAVFFGVVNKSLENAAARFSEWAAPLRRLLPEDALLEFAQDRPGADPNEAIEGRDFVKASPDTCARAAKALTDRPDILGPSDWRQMQSCMSDPSMKTVGRGAWDRIVRPGTGLLTNGPWSVGAGEKEPEFQAALDRAPWSAYHRWLKMQRSVGLRILPTNGELLEAYDPFLEFDPRIMMLVVNQADDPDLVEKMAKRACQLDVEVCGLAGFRLAQWGRVDAALPLGARAVSRSQNAIALSQSVSWYVSALLERGRINEAMRVARRMADVYSAGGLSILARAYERMGQFKEASETYRLITQRYARPAVEDEFLIRHAHRHGAWPFEGETKAAVDRVFPKGLLRVGPGESTPTTRPLSLNNQRLFSIDFRAAGLAHRDSLIAVDGFLIENEEQFTVVLTFSDAPQTRFLVRRGSDAGGKVEELTARYPRRHFDLVSKARLPA